jgi:predicted nucleic acid-binding protein
MLREIRKHWHTDRRVRHESILSQPLCYPPRDIYCKFVLKLFRFKQRTLKSMVVGGNSLYTLSCISSVKLEIRSTSYTWDNRDNLDDVLLNRNKFLRFGNAEAALRRLGQAPKPQTLWVDAICIYSDGSLIKHLRNLSCLLLFLKSSQNGRRLSTSTC